MVERFLSVEKVVYFLALDQSTPQRKTLHLGTWTIQRLQSCLIAI